jgi:hypothetical protein
VGHKKVFCDSRPSKNKSSRIAGDSGEGRFFGDRKKESVTEKRNGRDGEI